MPVNGKTVATAVKRAVEWGLAHRVWKPLHVIGLDEVSRRKRHRYLTLVYDQLRRRLVWVGADRDAKTAWLGPRRDRSIQVVCCDMWAIYIDAVKANLPEAMLVFDRFHVVHHLSHATTPAKAGPDPASSSGSGGRLTAASTPSKTSPA
jgi:Transposase